MNYDSKIDAADPDVAVDLGGDGRAPGRSPLRRIIAIGVIALALIVALWYFTRPGENAAADDGNSQAPVVSVLAPGTTTIPGTIEAAGTLAARRAMPVGVVGEGGMVTRVLVEAGDWVGAGQVLAVIDRNVQTQQQASLAAQVQVAQADARLAQANLDRALRLVDRGFISKQDVDQLTATRDAAVARVQVAQAQLAEMRERTSRLNIVAPAAGLVLERNVEPGQVVSPGTGTLFLMARGGEMEMLAELSEADLAQIPVGVNASVVPAGTDKSFTGQVWQVSPVIDEQSRQGTARIALSYAPELRPGGFATAKIASGAIVAPLLPQSAVLSDRNGSYVFIVGEGNVAERRKVTPGPVLSNGISIVDGLSGGERVVIRAGGFLSEGETIQPRAVKREDAF